ncbi:MAG TPA: hypothetical protein VL346_03825 [Acidobacteriaceae bacterium]|nr:hypothetical protein [Acidobacteriaceae bacterium]
MSEPVPGNPASADPASASLTSTDPAPAGGTTRGIGSTAPAVLYGQRAFSRFSIGGSFGALGVGVAVSTNLVPHLNLRAGGNYLGFGVNNYSAQGFNIDANLHLASARATLDYYPFHKGFRLSPGVMFYNQNHAVANFTAQQGASFDLNDHTYYSATGDQTVRGLGRVRMGNGSPAFTATTGWGNTIPRAGRHFSFPFEIGAAFTSAPTFALDLIGFVCDAHGENCVNVATDPDAQANLRSQVAKYTHNLEPLKTYPILSFGVAYSFGSGRISTVR